MVLFLVLFLRGAVSEHVFGVTPDTAGRSEAMVLSYGIECLFLV